MSAMPLPQHGETLDRLLLDQENSDRALNARIADMLRPLAREGVDLNFTVHVKGAALTVKTDPPPRRWVVEGPRLRRQP